MIRLRSLVWLSFVVLAGSLVYLISHAVDTERSRLRRLNAGILSEQDSIRVLNAEWSHLARPERLADLADRHTRLINLGPADFLRADQLPIKSTDAPIETAATDDAPAVKTTVAVTR